MKLKVGLILLEIALLLAGMGLLSAMHAVLGRNQIMYIDPLGKPIPTGNKRCVVNQIKKRTSTYNERLVGFWSTLITIDIYMNYPII